MGMNFKVGFFDNPSFFFVVVGLMVSLAVVTLVVARWRTMAVRRRAGYNSRVP